MKKPIVVNLTGAPGAGKSTGAAFIFAELKKAGVNAELVTEFAKDKTWEHNVLALGCQEYVFGKRKPKQLLRWAAYSGYGHRWGWRSCRPRRQTWGTDRQSHRTGTQACGEAG